MAALSHPVLWDYLVFFAFIIASFVVPIYNKIAGPKDRTKADYVFAVGGVSMFSMMLSISRSTLGVRALLGYPSELFYRGSAMWETLYGLVLAMPVVCFVFLPVYFSLNITSVYQYLDMRFKSRLVRCLASFTYVLRILLTLGVTVFTPCLALQTVIGLPYWASIVSITTIGIIFNIMGGLKTAIYVDVMQALVTIACSVVIIVYGTVKSGGVQEVYSRNRDSGRLNFFNFDLDPTVRVSTVSALFGQLFMSASVFGCQQNLVQRYVSMPSRRVATRTILATMPTIVVLFSLSWIAGMVMYATYADCDPLSLGYIQKIDEILPFFVEREFLFLPGFLGLVMATLFTGALSMTMSNLNSTATVTWEDFLSQIPQLSKFTEKRQLIIIKLLGIVYGLVVMGMAYAVANLPGITESSMLVTSATSGPLLGVFVLAMLFPCANWKGTACGMIASHVTVMWITFGGLSIHKSIPALPLATDGCTNTSFRGYTAPPLGPGHMLRGLNTTQFHVGPVDSSESDVLTQLYSVTYMYYSLLGCGITIVVGVIVSYIVGTSPEDAFDEMLIHPAALKCSTFFPGKPRKYTSDAIPSRHDVGDDGASRPSTHVKRRPPPVSAIPSIYLIGDVVQAKTPSEKYTPRIS